MTTVTLYCLASISHESGEFWSVGIVSSRLPDFIKPFLLVIKVFICYNSTNVHSFVIWHNYGYISIILQIISYYTTQINS